MPLESATYIDGLNASNPVGSTDKVQTLDDHIRLIKSALKASFPGVTGAVSASHAELNILDGATLSTAELNILDGVTLTASQINDAARLSANNAFTGTASWTSAGDSNHIAITAATVSSFYGSGTANARLGTSSNHPLKFYTNNAEVGQIAANGVWTLNGVAQTDFARLSQNNVFTLPQNVTVSGADANFTATRSGAASAVLSGSSSYAIIGSLSNHPVAFIANSATAMEISAAGAVKAPAIANSTSTTLVAGQIHFIDGDATLPNLTAGQWVQVVNDGSSSRTISKNGSDTTYWTATGAGVSSGFTLAARGVLTARCNADGSRVYVSGSGITGAS